jgi:hypothetical protein
MHLCISALERLRQENCEFEASLSYIAKPHLKERNNLTKTKSKQTENKTIVVFRSDNLIF